MLITIDTEEALKYSLSVQDLAVLDVIRRLLAADGGAVETHANRAYKWLSNSTILRHLQCGSFRSARQLHNIINKLCAVGLLAKCTYFGKPYYHAPQRKTKAATAAPRQNRAAAPSVAAPVPRAVAPTVAAAPSVPGTSAAPSVAPSVPRRVDAPTVAAAPSVPGTSAAPTVAPPVPRRVDAPTVAAAPVPSVSSALHADHTAEPTPEEVRAALAAIDQKTAEHEKRAAAVIEQRKKAFAATIQKLVPTLDMLNAHIKEMKWQDFDLDGFITFNTERNWSALRKHTWKQLAAMWYDQQCKKMSELITYDQYCIITGKDHAAASLWTFHHKDPKTGVSYFSRVQSAAIVGGASTGVQKNAAPLSAPEEGSGKRYMESLESQPKAAPGNNPQR